MTIMRNYESTTVTFRTNPMARTATRSNPIEPAVTQAKKLGLFDRRRILVKTEKGSTSFNSIFSEPANMASGQNH